MSEATEETADAYKAYGAAFGDTYEKEYGAAYAEDSYHDDSYDDEARADEARADEPRGDEPRGDEARGEGPFAGPAFDDTFDDGDLLPPPLQYRFDGPEEAPVLVLGPALGTTWHMWDRQLPVLSGAWRVLRYELPGHGGAPADPASSVDDLARRLLAVLDDEGIDTFGYAGCGLGAAVGARLALLRPDRVAALALVSAAARYATADTWRQRGVVVRASGLDNTARATPERWFTGAFRATQPAITDWAVQMVRTTDTACYVAACEALAAFDIRDALGSITVPTLVVAGADDTETPPADARLLVAGIPDARLAVVPATGHLAPVEEPAAVGDLLARHFESAWAERAPASAPFAPAPPAVPPRVPAPPAARPAPDAYQEGMRIRRELTGDAEVEAALARAEGFGGGFDAFATRYAWGEIWSRPGLDRRTRSLVTLTALTALGHLGDLADHTRAALRNGVAPAEIEEVLLHTAVYCGLPAARAALDAARAVIQEETGQGAR
ncbi:alpha/beta fold hydrolase [Streptomyces sp.]|uniref:bifunctional 3-oxoadipate enol-lactonase/4-carboxymuconolactone decarboxylase PcaDC n=1 Tax=Streptomyces sp. TaxID=1931 RepID=UPI002F3F5076